VICSGYWDYGDNPLGSNRAKNVMKDAFLHLPDGNSQRFELVQQRSLTVALPELWDAEHKTWLSGAGRRLYEPHSLNEEHAMRPPSRCSVEGASELDVQVLGALNYVWHCG
jgi:hypothetical protein